MRRACGLALAVAVCVFNFLALTLSQGTRWYGTMTLWAVGSAAITGLYVAALWEQTSDRD